METYSYYQVALIKKTPEYKEFLEYYNVNLRLLLFVIREDTISGNIYKMLNVDQFIRSSKDYYIWLIKKYIYESPEYKEINVCLKLIYLFYKDIYIVFNTVIINKY